MRKESEAEYSRWAKSNRWMYWRSNSFLNGTSDKDFHRAWNILILILKKWFYFELWICECILNYCVINEVKWKNIYDCSWPTLINFISRKWFQGSFQSNAFGNWINFIQCIPTHDVIWKLLKSCCMLLIVWFERKHNE